jgi:uncharacterized repeat protein (TIGR02543 family)
LTGITAVAAGDSFTVALKNDSTVYTWGRNNYGQLGDATGTNKTTPVQVYNLRNVVAIAAGGSQAIAIKTEGTIWTWGRDFYGALGNTTVDEITRVPRQVTNLNAANSIMNISVGTSHMAVLKTDGTAWTWGYNYYGQLGNNGTYNSNPSTNSIYPSPVQVKGPNAEGTFEVFGEDPMQLYTVSYSANGGSGAPGNQFKIHDVALTLSGVIPTKDGYTFLGWSAQQGATTATYPASGIYNTNAGIALFAVWQVNTIPTYAVTVTNGTGGGNYATGATVTITAGTPPTGQQFKNWTVNSGGITLANANSTSTTFTMPANAVAVTANFEPIPATTYALTVTSGTGSGN